MANSKVLAANDASPDLQINSQRRNAKAAKHKVAVRQPLASLSAPYQRGSDWDRVHEGSISFPQGRSGRGTKGPRPLVSMCLRVLADNIGACSRSLICELPEKLQWALWKELLPRTMSFHAWNILSYELVGASSRRADETIRHKEGQTNEVTIPMALIRYCQEIIDPPCELSIYISPLANTTSLVYLCIDNVTRFESNELLSLAQLHQLAVLELIEREPMGNYISDRLIRGWTEMMKSQSFPAHPFHKLRVLKITSRTHAVSEGSLHSVLEFPALEIFDITALPAQRWRKARDIATEHGWKATEPEDSVFVSYANAYLGGRVVVHPSGVDRLRTAFEDDRLRLSLVANARRGRREGHDQASFAEQGCEGEGPPPGRNSHLDDGWRALLQGNLPLSTTDESQASGRTQHQPDMSDNEIFWFLSLLDQTQHGKDAGERNTQAQLAGVTLLRDRFISLRLRTPPAAADQHRELLGSQRLIFSRRQTEATVEATVAKASERDAPEPSWASRPDDRRERNLKPRKRQKVGDIFSSFGM